MLTVKERRDKGNKEHQMEENENIPLPEEREELEPPPSTQVGENNGQDNTVAIKEIGPNKAEQTHEPNTECETKEAGDKDKQVEERVQTKVLLLEITNTAQGNGEEKPRNKTWKRQAHQAVITYTKRKENEEQGGLKRKVQDCEDMEINNSELKMGKVRTTTINRTAEAAKQPCRDQ
ncbi:hypothetical protein PIB30_067507 [Stylosanthes scabra]|uniref:Uncharacterized protein n=1 Tax=Stylosanthes scabra TaxID=79078 RepID=A0ABU6TMV0_9FABA|nr:hypothetical protein [Stylosanthes scabra]